MSQNTISLLQALCNSVQLINAGIGTITHDAVTALIVGAIAAGFSMYVQKIGNASLPPAPEPPEPKPAKGSAA